MRKDPVAEKYVHEGVIERLVKDGMSVEDAIRAFRECIGFLKVCATTRGRIAPTKRIDAAWHQFILFTVDYAAFCDEFFGFFIHHQPDFGAHKTTPDLLVKRHLLAAAMGLPVPASGTFGGPGEGEVRCYGQEAGCKAGLCSGPCEQCKSEGGEKLRAKPGGQAAESGPRPGDGGCVAHPAIPTSFLTGPAIADCIDSRAAECGDCTCPWVGDRAKAPERRMSAADCESGGCRVPTCGNDCGTKCSPDYDPSDEVRAAALAARKAELNRGTYQVWS